jgi:hypothetical protein
MSKKRTTKRAGKKATFEAFECWAPLTPSGCVQTWFLIRDDGKPRQQLDGARKWVRVRITPADAPDYERVVRSVRRWLAKERREYRQVADKCALHNNLSGQDRMESGEQATINTIAELTRLTAAQRQKGGE